MEQMIIKKILILLLAGFLGLVSQARADEEPRSITGWIIQADLNTSLPIGSQANVVNPGWGSEVSLGYRFPIDLEFSVETGFDTYSGSTNSFNQTWTMMPLVFKVQYGFGDRLIQPYVFFGAGLALNIKTASSDASLIDVAEADFLDEAGFGLDFELMDNTSFFVQSKIEIDYTSTNYAASQLFLFPLTGGFKFLLN